ncbi:hypothetical protein F4810DRAFT_70076 [Camillea tinctor]|nr:hypothetical protein F4810DRAFT_70076 [Camillea tinctor]
METTPSRKSKPAPLNNDSWANTSSNDVNRDTENDQGAADNDNGEGNINSEDANGDPEDPNSSKRKSAVVWLQPDTYSSIRSMWQDQYIWSPVAVNTSLPLNQTSFLQVDDADDVADWNDPGDDANVDDDNNDREQEDTKDLPEPEPEYEPEPKPESISNSDSAPGPSPLSPPLMANEEEGGDEDRPKPRISMTLPSPVEIPRLIKSPQPPSPEPAAVGNPLESPDQTHDDLEETPDETSSLPLASSKAGEPEPEPESESEPEEPEAEIEAPYQEGQQQLPAASPPPAAIPEQTPDEEEVAAIPPSSAAPPPPVSASASPSISPSAPAPPQAQPQPSPASTPTASGSPSRTRRRGRPRRRTNASSLSSVARALSPSAPPSLVSSRDDDPRSPSTPSTLAFSPSASSLALQDGAASPRKNSGRRQGGARRDRSASVLGNDGGNDINDKDSNAGNANGTKSALTLRLDLNLEVEVELKATLRGDLTLTLL